MYKITIIHRDLVTVKCPVCGKDFKKAETNTRKKYCSDECAKNAVKLRRIESKEGNIK